MTDEEYDKRVRDRVVDGSHSARYTVERLEAEIERLTACVAEYIVQTDEIASQAAEIAAMKDELTVRRMPRDEIYEGLQNAIASANAALSELDDAKAEIERLRADLEREIKFNAFVDYAYNAQAAEIAALKEIVKNDGDVLIRAGVLFDKDRIITAQAAEIERLRKQHGLWHETSIPQLYAENASQAAEVERLKAVLSEHDVAKAATAENIAERLSKHWFNDTLEQDINSLLASQAGEIERLRGRIQIAGGTLVAWLREQGGGVDPVRHALATLRAIP